MSHPLAALALLTASALALPAAAQIPEAAGDTRRSYALPAGPLGPVLNQIVSGTGLALSLPADLVQGRLSPGVNGQGLSPTEALQRALAGTGLQLVPTASGALSLQLQPASSAPVSGTTLRTVEVRSSAPVATSEGQGSYTAQFVSIGKGLATLRETPQSISVVTRDKLDDQNAVSLGDAMHYVTGIRVFSTSTGVVNLRSRGFRLNNYLLDGMPLRGGQGMWGSALMDMALYDRIEVWRGPAGLLEGAGEPSGTINLARKRALATPRTQVAAMVGSWDHYRSELDTTRALNADGSLRARLVAVEDRRHSFVDAVMQDNRTLYGTLEYDFSPRTTLSLGHTWQRGRSVAFAGLPLIAGGASPDFPRSTFVGSRHGLKRDSGHSSFVELAHRTDQGGVWRTTANEYSTRNTLDRFISNSLVNAQTREVDVEGAWQKSVQINRGFDSYWTQPFQWGGRTQEFTVGANVQEFRGGQIQQRYRIWRQNIDQPDHDLVLPASPLGAVPEPRTREYGSYASLRLRPRDGLTLLAAARMAWWDSSNPAAPQDSQSVNGRFVPNLGIVADLDAHWSAYASYNRIFSPQTERSVDGAYLAPRTGEQFEIGLKGEFFDQALTSQFALFRINDQGRAIDDPANRDYSVAAGQVRSQGLEMELSGKLTPRWSLTAGYAYTQTLHRDDVGQPRGQAFDSTFPRHQFSVWTRYELPADWLAGAYVGGGVRAASRTHADYGGVRWQQGGLAVFALQAGYSWRPGWSLSLTVNNLFDKRYFERFAGGSARQTYYGDPANATLTLRAQF